MSSIPSGPARALALATAAVVALLAVAPAAAWGQENRNRLIYSLRLQAYGARGSFLGQLSYNCADFFNGGRAVQQQGRWVYVNGDGQATGRLNVGAGSGEVFLKRRDWQAEALPPAPARPARFADVGLSLRGGKLFVTARITRGRPLFSAARRMRIAVARGVKIESGPLLDEHKRPIPNSFSVTGSGRLKMLPAMARAIERIRCKNRRRNRLSRRIKAGTSLGRFVFGVRPDRATGLAGSAQIALNVSADSYSDEVTVEPVGGMTLSDNRLVAPIASGVPLPLGCYFGTSCFLSGGSLGLGGGFDLVFQGRRTSLAGLVLTTTGAGQTLTGTLDGAPVTLATRGPATEGRPPFTSDFAQRAGAALGTSLVGNIDVEPAFTHTGPG